MSDDDLLDTYAAVDRRPSPDRPWVLINMVSSVDGATAIDGASGRLGGPGDKRVFAAIRSVADVIMAGAGTVRAEGYGPPRPAELVQQRRRARGQAPTPRMAVVSGRLDLDPTSALFTDVDEPTMICTVSGADQGRRAGLAEVADIVDAGTTRVEPVTVMAALAARGASVVLVEGGPTLNAQLFELDLVDELCLTVAPTAAKGDSPRIAPGAAGDPLALELIGVLEEDGALFLHYVRRR